MTKKKRFIKIAEDILNNNFPDYVIRLQTDPDGASTLFAYTFFVPEHLKQIVKEEIRTCIKDKLNNYPWDIIPPIKDDAKKYGLGVLYHASDSLDAANQSSVTYYELLIFSRTPKGVWLKDWNGKKKFVLTKKRTRPAVPGNNKKKGD